MEDYTWLDPDFNGLEPEVQSERTCGHNRATQAKVSAPSEKSEVGLHDAQVVFEPPGLLRFEVHYRFTKGQPTMSYMCDLSFPGTNNLGKKPLEAW